MRRLNVLDAFAGPGGWDEGLRMLGVDARVVGVEWDRDACRTAVAAGHPRVRADVASFPLGHLAGMVDLAMMSPPCQAWSKAGKRQGILDQPGIVAHAQRVIAAGEWIPYARDGWHDDRSPLVLEVLRWVLAVRPRAVVLEQVPEVLPFWRLVARWLGGLGYSTWTGVLSAERYGVPQTRERAFVIASLDRRVSCPAPTHTAYDRNLPDGGKWHGTDGDLFGAGLLPWVSMAEALGYAGGLAVTTRGDRQTPGGNVFAADRPSWALTEKVRSWTVAPMPHTNRGQCPDGTRQVVDTSARPAPTLTAISGDQWKLSMGDVRSANGTVRAVSESSGSLTASMDNGNYRWTYVNGNQANAGRRDSGQPAPTVHFAERMNDVRWVAGGESVRVSVEEAAALQSFPTDYSWRGSRSAQYRQIGDAVPPLLARAVCAEALGVDVGAVADVA